MLKAKTFFSLLLSFLFVCFFTQNTFARALTNAERQAYAAENIIFFTPCSTEEDCKNPYSAITSSLPATEDDTPSDPDSPSSPSTPTTNPNLKLPSTPSGSGAKLIVETAMAMAWPNPDGYCVDNTGAAVKWTPSAINRNAPCQDTMSDYLKSKGYTRVIQDCGKFVGIVIRNSVDPSFQASGVKWQIDYMRKHRDLWAEINANSLSNLMEGDVLAYSENGHGHIVIWIGNDTTVPCSRGRCSVNIASSSTGDHPRTPSLNKQSSLSVCYYDNGRHCLKYSVFRWQKD